MSEPRYEVVFMRGHSEVDVPFQDKTLAEAQDIARTLNDGLQSRARALGFSYAVRPQKPVEIMTCPNCGCSDKIFKDETEKNLYWCRGCGYGGGKSTFQKHEEGAEHDATDDMQGYEESRRDYLPEPEW
jgi:predicted RNA-binding Zn-ribbon protein involved in translation (DUF1610 family)